jgi:VIT1/CCC1 family predicted Fe2+/Mn2+ transporter
MLIENRPSVEEYDHHRTLHYQGSRIRDILLGGQDGLVNVLGVILGVAAASSDIRIIIAAGLAATFAESISMGAVAYTSAKAEEEYYLGEMIRERDHIIEHAHIEKEEIRKIFEQYAFEGDLLDRIVKHITADEERWIKLMMSEEFELQPVSQRDVFRSSMIVGFSAIVGSLIPLLPFFFLTIAGAEIVSVLISAAALFVTGFYKARVMKVNSWLRSGLSLMVIGILSALVGYLIGLVFKV